ncbi:hypothetical protein PU629_18605 [Pullulanibacillus sp. KACC 23026]|uniref:hypothetical protein n=1 Tax=Pullulanibacillus sp. KACC 23026 TaxID=3028315 RepID=UPI0023B19418|nr:hypothetical protein [Pullulanibacillus sp. KACC 23026]WEG12109.1 hypothetical protein PU629_18605 [Pullulanibacillus sp. KACC 23026]
MRIEGLDQVNKFKYGKVDHMSGEKDYRLFYISLGYLGYLSIAIAFLRYILILNDEMADVFIIIGVGCLGSFTRFLESKFPFFSSVKEKRIFKRIFNGALMVIVIIGIGLTFFKSRA